MRWAIKHKSGRVLFVTDSKVTADNREKMGWIVEELTAYERMKINNKENQRIVSVNVGVLKAALSEIENPVKRNYESRYQ